MHQGGGTASKGTTGEDRRREISELFHAINQPLTTLCCSLELALYQNWTAEQYREGVAQALEQAGYLSGLLAGARQLWEAEDPGELRRVVWLDTAIAETVQDLLPVARERQVEVSCCCAARLPVLAEPRRMRQGLFYLAESALNRAQSGSEFRVTADLHEDSALLGFMIASAGERIPGEHADSTSAKPTEEPNGLIQLPLMVARRIFEAAGGSYQILRDGHHLSFRVRLPLCPLSTSVEGTENRPEDTLQTSKPAR